MTKVAIIHDVTDSFGRQEPTYREVLSYRLPDALVNASPEAVLEAAFHEFNVGDGPLAQEYRAKGLRSLSIGDLVRIGEIYYACDKTGWLKIGTSQSTILI